MSRFDLLYAFRNELERTVKVGDLISALFDDHPDLETFQVDVTNEYDDNNYSDYCRLATVNGYSVDYDGEYEEEEDEEDEAPSTPKASEKAVSDAMGITEYIKEEWGYGDHTFNRADFAGGRTTKEIVNSPNLSCLMGIMAGAKVSVEALSRCDDRFVLIYAENNGRFSPEDEFSIFAREGMMWAAKEYAQKHGPLSEKTLNYWVLSLKSEDHEYEHLQEYLDWAKAA